MGDEKSKAQEMRRQYNRHSHGYTSTNMEEDDLIMPLETANDHHDPLSHTSMGKYSSNENEWDGRIYRKGSIGSHPSSFRNDLTPLNTPCTPQLIKLQLKAEAREASTQAANRFDPTKEFIGALKDKAMYIVQPINHVRAFIDLLLHRIVSEKIAQWRLYVKYRGWLISYLTLVVCIPFVLALSPLVIALFITTSPIWIAGLVVLFFRTLVRPFARSGSPLAGSAASIANARMSGGGTTTISGPPSTSIASSSSYPIHSVRSG